MPKSSTGKMNEGGDTEISQCVEEWNVDDEVLEIAVDRDEIRSGKSLVVYQNANKLVGNCTWYKLHDTFIMGMVIAAGIVFGLLSGIHTHNIVVAAVSITGGFALAALYRLETITRRGNLGDFDE